MLARALRVGWCAVFGLVAISFRTAEARDVKPENLLTAECVAAIQFDGLEPHRSSFDPTALAELLRNDLGPLAAEVQKRILNALGPDVVARGLLSGGRPEELVALQADAKQLPRVFDALRKRGVLAGIELAKGIPGGQLTLVFPGGGADEERAALASAVRLAARSANIKLSETKNGTRTILAGTFFGLGKLACWPESAHFMITVGTLPIEPTLAVADGSRKSLADDPRWAEVGKFEDYDTYLRGFLDTALLQKWSAGLVGTVKPILAQLGLDGLTNVAFHLGFEGRYLRSTVVASTAQKRSGILQLLVEGDPLAPGSLPPLAPDASTVIALRSSPEEIYRFFTQTVQKITDVVDPSKSEEVRGDLADFETAVGGDAAKKAIAALGPTIVGYSEPGGGIPFFGGGLAIQVRDSAAFEQNRDAVLRGLEKVGGDSMAVLRREYRGVKLYVFQFKEQNFFAINPTFAVCDGWLYFGLAPQSVQSAIFRAKGSNKRLEFVADLRDRMARLAANGAEPDKRGKLIAFAQTDPRPSVQVLLGVLPLFSSIVSAMGGDGFLPKFDPTLMPSAQAITESLSPNFWLLTDQQNALRFDSYSTVPMPFDFSTMGALTGFAALGFGF